MTEKIPYWKSNRFLGSFVWKNGEDGCVICEEDGSSISMDRSPPPLRDQAPPPKPDIVESKPVIEKSDPWKNLALAVIGAVDGVRRLKQWAATPPAPASPELPKPESALNELVDKKKAAFDLQQIPAALKKLGGVKGAALLQKWFEGEMNYSPTEYAAKAGLNQNGRAFPPSMVDRKTVTMKWVLSFSRAEQAFDKLLNEMVYTEKALSEIKKCLEPWKTRAKINAYDESSSDVVHLHRGFQFQHQTVGGGVQEKIAQYLSQEVKNRGIPDDLTFTLGAFNIYVAIGDAFFTQVTGGVNARLTTVYIYIKDSFDFNDFGETGSQYLGHWNESGVALVPLAALPYSLWSSTPILPQTLLNQEGRMYPVTNSSFRQWRSKHLRGGDFFIYSDPVCRWLKNPITVFLKNEQPG